MVAISNLAGRDLDPTTADEVWINYGIFLKLLCEMCKRFLYLNDRNSGND